jgi:hypothetical protein
MKANEKGGKENMGKQEEGNALQIQSHCTPRSENVWPRVNASHAGVDEPPNLNIVYSQEENRTIDNHAVQCEVMVDIPLDDHPDHQGDEGERRARPWCCLDRFKCDDDTCIDCRNKDAKGMRSMSCWACGWIFKII